MPLPASVLTLQLRPQRRQKRRQSRACDVENQTRIDCVVTGCERIAKIDDAAMFGSLFHRLWKSRERASSALRQ